MLWWLLEPRYICNENSSFASMRKRKGHLRDTPLYILRPRGSHFFVYACDGFDQGFRPYNAAIHWLSIDGSAEGQFRELPKSLLMVFFRSKSSELGRKPLEVESPMRFQAPHLTHRLSFTGYLTEQTAKVFRQSLPIGDLNPQSLQQWSKTIGCETRLIGTMHPGRQIQQLQIVQR